MEVKPGDMLKYVDEDVYCVVIERIPQRQSWRLFFLADGRMFEYSSYFIDRYFVEGSNHGHRAG